MFNELSINLILIFSALFYFGFIIYQKKHKIFPFSADILKQETSKRLPLFDYIKGIAILGILAYHVSYLLNFVDEDFPGYFIHWNQYIARISMFAIPAFFISSGALLTISNAKKKEIIVFYKGKLKKLLIPYLIFSLPAFFILFFCISQRVSNIFVSLLVLPLWFIPFLLMLYLIYPALWYFLVAKRIRPRLFLFFMFVFAVGYYILSIYWSDWPFSNSVFGLYAFFFALGMVLRPMILTENRDWLKKINLIFWSILAIAFYFIIGFISPKEGLLNYQFIYGPVVFLLLFYYFNQLYRFPFAKFIEKIGKNSLYFYLIHFYILVFLISAFKFFNLFYINPIIIFISLFILGFLITCFLVFGGMKIFGGHIRIAKSATYSVFIYSKKSVKNLLFHS